MPLLLLRRNQFFQQALGLAYARFVFGTAAHLQDVVPGAHAHAHVDGHRPLRRVREDEAHRFRGRQTEFRHDRLEVMRIRAQAVQPDDRGLRPRRRFRSRWFQAFASWRDSTACARPRCAAAAGLDSPGAKRHHARRRRTTMRRTLMGAALLALALPLAAQEIKLPATLTLTAYDTGSSGFNIAVAVGKAFKDKHGTDVRVLPAGNDVARLAPLKGGRAQASAMGIGVYFAQEGVFEFAVKDWGPQPLRLILASSRLQRDLARRRQGHRRQGGQGPQGQAHRHGGRLAGAQPERVRGARLRRPDAQGRRQAGRVLQLRRDVEGHPQQRGGRGDRLDHLRAGEGGREPRRAACSTRRRPRPTRRAGRG